MLIISSNLLAILTSIMYCNNKNKEIIQSINNNKIIDEVLHTKILNLEKKLENMEKFKFKILEKNSIVNENRVWDHINTDEDEDEDEEY